MKIENIKELEVLALNNDTVANILRDKSIGRKKATYLIYDFTGDSVSEKLVRTWREKTRTPTEAEIQENIRKFEETILSMKPKMPKPSGPAEPYYAIHVQDPVLYTEAAKSRIERYDPTTPVGPVTAEHAEAIKKATTLGSFSWGSIPEDRAIKNVPRKTIRKKSSYNIVIMPDVQAPLHDEKLVDKFVQFLADYEPDQLGQVGDFTDSTEISRWVRGKKGEFAGDLQKGLDVSRYILEKIRDVYDGQFQIVRSNHDDRLELYIAGCAPGLEGLRALTIENLAGFHEYEVDFVRDGVVNLTPNLNNPWIMCHGDEGSMSPMAGKTAFNLAKNKFGANVVCGHTHRAGFTSESYGFNGRQNRRLSGLEVGHFMDMTKADYLKKKGVAANWQQAFGIIEVCGSTVQANLIDVDINGNFIVDGVLY